MGQRTREREREEMRTGFWLGYMCETVILEKVDGRIILKCISIIEWGGRNWVDLALQRER